MNPSRDLPSARLAAVLHAYQDNLASLVSWMDPSWCTVLLGIPSVQAGLWHHAVLRADGQTLGHCSRALADAAGIPFPTFATLARIVPESSRSGLGPGRTRSHAALLDVLPVRLSLQVLRMRALLFRRAEARRLIDRQARTRILEWTGVSLDQLLQATGSVGIPDLTPVQAHAAMPPLATMDALGLAAEGSLLILRDLGLDAATHVIDDHVPLPFPLLRLALPRVLPVPPWPGGGARLPEACGSTQLFSRLAGLLPEFSWLFG